MIVLQAYGNLTICLEKLLILFRLMLNRHVGQEQSIPAPATLLRPHRRQHDSAFRPPCSICHSNAKESEF